MKRFLEIKCLKIIKTAVEAEKSDNETVQSSTSDQSGKNYLFIEFYFQSYENNTNHYKFILWPICCLKTTQKSIFLVKSSESKEKKMASGKLIANEAMKEGTVDSEVFKNYFNHFGWKSVIIILCLNITRFCLWMGENLWLASWSDDSKTLQSNLTGILVHQPSKKEMSIISAICLIDRGAKYASWQEGVRMRIGGSVGTKRAFR